MKSQAEIEEYLAKIRKTIAESEAAVQQAELRIRETDRLLESRGLTREEVLKWQPTKEQRLAVNEELRRRGLPPLEEDDSLVDDWRREAPSGASLAAPAPAKYEPSAELEERRRGFGMLMREYRI